jgi:hypothetical protein
VTTAHGRSDDDGRGATDSSGVRLRRHQRGSALSRTNGPAADRRTAFRKPGFFRRDGPPSRSDELVSRRISRNHARDPMRRAFRKHQVSFYRSAGWAATAVCCGLASNGSGSGSTNVLWCTRIPRWPTKKGGPDAGRDGSRSRRPTRPSGSMRHVWFGRFRKTVTIGSTPSLATIIRLGRRGREEAGAGKGGKGDRKRPRTARSAQPPRTVSSYPSAPVRTMESGREKARRGFTTKARSAQGKPRQTDPRPRRGNADSKRAIIHHMILQRSLFHSVVRRRLPAASAGRFSFLRALRAFVVNPLRATGSPSPGLP